MSAARLALLCACLCFHVVSVLSQFGFFPQRESRRQFGFGDNFFPNPRRITQNLASILHFRPGDQNGNQQNPFNNIPGISNSRPTYDQYPPEPNYHPNNVRFPDSGRDIPNDPVNFEPSNPEFNSNGGLISGNDSNGLNNENNGLVSGTNNGPVFDNNNGGHISGSNNGQPVFDSNNGGLTSGSNNGQPVFDSNNGGLISGSNNGQPVFGSNSGGLISGSNNGQPVFDSNNGGLISGSNNGQPVFDSNNGGLISGSNNGQPVFDSNNGGLISGSNNGQPVFDSNNGGLISGINNGQPVFGSNSGGLISGSNNGQPVFDNNKEGLNSDTDNDGSSEYKEKRPTFVEIEDGGAISSYDDGKQEPPTPVMVVDDASGLSFGDRTGEEEPDNGPKNNLSFGGEGETCQTVDGYAGSCISIRSCGPYLKLLQQSQSNPQAVRVLRNAHCGFEGNFPKVCCPRQDISEVTPQPQPQQPQPTPTASTKNVGDFLTGFPEPPLCGVSSASFSRVVGGINATLGDFPWMALLGYKSKRDGTTRWLCGGSLVSSRHVLTAAHCIHNHEEDLYLVRLGELDLARDDEGATPIDVIIKTKVKHEGYDPKSFMNDIGVLLLDRDVPYTDLIKPICIPRSPELRARNFVDYNPMIAGWGDTEFRGPSASLLQVLQLPVVSNEFCAQAYAQYSAQVIDQRVLCAGFKKGGKDACQGDSGGPLMQPIWNSETYKTYFYQIGVVSYGKRCAEAGFPGVYTRVTEFVPWIQKVMLGSA